ncbi:MAG: DUF86 domain-containing protein [Candidatus Bathyarchaeia archaeon]|jgi:uncharacterized protein with HEPN domain
MKDEFLDYVEDILKAMDDALTFVKDMNYDAFVKDRKTIYAVIRALEIIGEATKNIPSPIKTRYPEIPWKDMAGMRDKVIHAYFGVDLKRVWSTVNADIPTIKPYFEKLLRDNEKR